MRRSSYAVLLAFFCLCPQSALLAQSSSGWLHVEVNEKTADPALVKINLPLSLVDVALGVVKDENLKSGRLKLDMHDISVADLRRLWSELKKSGNADFVTVEKKGESVRIARQGNYLLVKVSESERKNSKVDLKIPFHVVDALLSGTGDELNIKAAIAAMQHNGVGEILTVHDNQTQVRIWVD
jgi:hypothetical protein